MLVSRVPKVKACTCAQPAPLALAAACRKCSSIREYDDIEPEISQSATRFGQRVRRALSTRSRTSPPERSAARIVPRQSGTRPRGSTRVRRLAIGFTGSSSRAIARRASACSAADICSKSIRWSASRAEKLSVASTSTSRPSPPSSGRGASGRSSSASAARRSAGANSRSSSRPRTTGVTRRIMYSMNSGSRQNSRNTWAKTARCSGRPTKQACRVK